MEKLLNILSEVIHQAFLISIALVCTLAVTISTESLFFGLAFLLYAMYLFGLALYDDYTKDV